MGTPEFAVPALNSLAKSDHEVIAVYTQPDEPSGRGRRVVPPPVKKAALAFGLNVHQPMSLRATEEVERLKGLAPGLIVVAAYAQMLSQAILDVPPHGCLNIHPSQLPRHRGPSPVAAAILAGDDVTGVSIMLMDKELDTGPVLAQRNIPVLAWDSTGSLTVKLADLGAELLADTLPLWLERRLVTQPQDSDRATYSKLIRKEDGRMDWARPSVQLWRQVRAFQPWPGCHTTWQSKLLKIVECVPLPGSGERGTVVPLDESQGGPVGVVTGEGLLGLVQLQLEGKRMMTAEEFVRGHRDFIGSVLPS